MQSTSMASSSSYSSSQSSKYDVFLSFRGEDTRKNFVDHLYKAFENRYYVYKDDETLQPGESIRPALFKAIEESKIAIVIFSERYGDSSWCLEELVHIMKCRVERGLVVIPVFYGVEPSEVRWQKRKFGEGFAKQKENTKVKTWKEALLSAFNIAGWEITKQKNTKVETWKEALLSACNISGWDIDNVENGHEAKAIQKIVDAISKTLPSPTSDVDEKYVGMRPRLQKLEDDIRKLSKKEDDVRMVGIWGVGGGGKTTLAYSFYNKYKEMPHHFHGHCFLGRDSESGKWNLRKLQETMISCISNTEEKVNSVEEGKDLIKGRLRHRRVLIILDDVDKKEQLDALVGARDWFGGGSRIIITTRDQHLLTTHGVNDFPLSLLSNEDAIQLFNKHAYNKEVPIKDYENLSSRVVSYAGGLPLALKVLGSFLKDKDEDNWESALKRLKEIPPKDIVDKLKISYDGLEPDEREIFLDIACFFRRYSTRYAYEIFEACGYQPRIVLTVLKQKSLITEVDGMLDMHDMVQEMGHYIVRGEHPNNHEKHSRVWESEEINKMCFGDLTMERDLIKAIRYSDPPDDLSDFCKLVSSMMKLRSLYVGFNDNAKRIDGPTFLSNELQYIHWNHYPTNPFPDRFFPAKLVVLKLFYSGQEVLWTDEKGLPCLKVLELHSMRNLLRTPNFDKIPHLQKLTLSYCHKLEEIHLSLGKNTSLEYISVSDCSKLRSFPTVHQMRKLKTLKIKGSIMHTFRGQGYLESTLFIMHKGCDDCLKFPKIESDMTSLVELSLEYVVIDDLLSSIGERCVNLTSLNFNECYNIKSNEANFDVFNHLETLTLHGLNCMKMRLPQSTYSLQKLNLGRCSLEDGKIPPDIQLFNLRELDLSSNDFRRLDFNIWQLTKLVLLNVSDCKKLVELPELPSNLVILKADGCSKLKAIGDSLKNCKWLCKVSLLYGSIINDGKNLLQSMLKGNAVENHSMVLHLQGLEIANGFESRLIKRDRCRLELPENWCNDFCGFLVCLVSESSEALTSLKMIMMQVMNGKDSQYDKVWEETDRYKYTCVWYVSFGSLKRTSWWNETYKAVAFDIGKPYQYLDRTIVEEESGFRVILVRKSGSGPTYTSTEESGFSHYTPNLKIEDDSSDYLKICLNS